MRKKNVAIVLAICTLLASSTAVGQSVNAITSPNQPQITIPGLVTISLQQQYVAVRPGSKSALAVRFVLEKNWHFYASAESAPGGVNLKLTPSSDKLLTFSKPIFPPSHSYFDKTLNQELDVFSDSFTVYLPFSVARFTPEPGGTSIDVTIAVDGALCSNIQCRVPDFGRLSTQIRIVNNAAMDNPNFTVPASGQPTPGRQPPSAARLASYSVWFALVLALLAGLTLNIMPCVWPVLPLIVMRIVSQARQSKAKSITMGLAFCLGILLFFASLAAVNIILRLFYHTVLQWGDQFRNPAFVGAMAILLILMALFMFGLFTITVPSAISRRAGSGSGLAGSVGMGFLAAILSTPCSFAILATAFAWAQAQPLFLGTMAIMVIGLGMAIPYAVLTSMPNLLSRLPKAGKWMEISKQAVGFILLFIAVKLIAALPQVRRMDFLYFAVVLAFCIWMWNSWVDYNTKATKKFLVRITAVILLLIGAWAFLSPPRAEIVDWRPYDASQIETALENKQPVLIKFTADWCLSCQVVEKVVFSRRDIADLIKEKKVLPIKADTTVKNYSATLALKNKYHEPGVPVTMLFIPGRQDPLRWRGLSFAEELKSYLQKLPTP